MDSILDVITGKAPMEAFDCKHLLAWVRANEWHAPVIACVSYVLLIFVIIPAIRWKVAPGYVKHLFALWNLILSIFSTFGFAIGAPYVYRQLSTHGLQHLVCSDKLMLGTKDDDAACYGTIGFAMSLFMLSKFPELGDTFFLAGMKKPLSFLHWYHHITVLLYSWFAYTNATPTAVTFGTINFGVHSVMYFYFCFANYTRKLGFMRKPITTIQLLQMAIGVSLTLLAYYFQQTTGCSATYTDSGFYLFCSCIYGSLCSSRSCTSTTTSPRRTRRKLPMPRRPLRKTREKLVHDACE